MVKFYDDQDYEKPKKPKSYTPELPKEVGHLSSIHNDVFLNDYRNRMPFHFTSDTEDYYYWQYGSVIELEITIGDIDTESYPIYVTDVLENNDSIVDPKTKIANLVLGTMAREDIGIYITSKSFEAFITEVVKAINKARDITNEANAWLDRIVNELEVGGKEVNAALIEELQRQINVLRNDLSTYASKIDGIQADVTQMKDLVAELKSKVANLHSVFNFKKSDWSKTGNSYVLTIPAKAHNIKKPYVIGVYLLYSGTSYNVPIDYDARIYENGVIKLYIDTNLDILESYSGTVFLGGYDE